MIILKGTIRIPKSAQKEALPALHAHIEATRQEAGNITFEITPDENDAELFHVYEEFSNEASFQTHQSLGRARSWGKISKDFKRDFHKVFR